MSLIIPTISSVTTLPGLSTLPSSASLPDFTSLLKPPTPSLSSLAGAGPSLTSAISGLSSLSGLSSGSSVIPTLPTLPGIPGLPVVNLTCGQNETLAQLDNIRSNIMGLLANKKAGLLALASQIPQAQGLLSQLQQKQELLYSLQNDIASLQASDYSPESILAFANRWGSMIPNAQLQSILATINNSISSGNGLDICGSIPNLNINPVTNAVVQLAPVSYTPNIAPIAASPLVATVIDNTQAVSTGNSSEKYQVITDFAQNLYTPVEKQVWDPLHAQKDSLVKAFQKALIDAAPLFAKIKKYGKNSKQLNDAGLLTPADLQLRDAYNKARQPCVNYNYAEPNVVYWFYYYQKLINGQITQSAFDAKRKSFVEDTNFALFVRYIVLTEKIVDLNKDTVKRYWYYSDNRSQ